MEGAKYVCSPPPRDEASQEACWEGIETGVFQVFSSDHCPFRYDDPQGKLDAEGAHEVPLGAERHPRRRDAAADPVLGRGREGPHRAQRLRGADRDQSRQDLRPASNKGTIAIGCDADIAIWDPDRAGDDQPRILHHGVDYTPYEGFEVTGWPVTTIVRGQVIVAMGACAAAVARAPRGAGEIGLCRAERANGDELRSAPVAKG